MNKDLRGNVAVITGASSGLGEQYARQLAARGADLVIAARRLDRLDKLAGELRQAHGVKVTAVKSDLSVAGSAKALFEAATGTGGDVTILVNNAGIGPYRPFLEASLQKHVETIQLNTTSLTELSYLFAAHMRAHGKRSYIVNIGSIASYQGCPNFSVYAGTKSFVRVLSEILNWELKGTKISVHCVCPGGTLTEFSEANGQQLTESAARFMMTAEDVVRIAIKDMFAGKTISIPGFVNKLACFLPRLFPATLSMLFAHVAMSKNAKPVASDRQLESK